MSSSLPADRNAGIQFRSQKINKHGQAQGYQADIGKDKKGWHLWGKLYHEHGGRGKLDWNDPRPGSRQARRLEPL